ncbi:class I SAM-dependent methyltransferase [Lentzea sp. NPDC051838]|uniref:class I SAM-dependent methyltransferase n=1 Tax=Lentzea sp. NPDC051838 TaxID=3154849 RepID=UPI00342FE7DB
MTADAQPLTYHELMVNTDESPRLDLMAAVYDPATTRVLSTIDVQKHWRCLDAGCGSASVAAWLAQRAPEGRTVACDLDVEKVAVRPSPALELMACDIAEADFAPGSFDLIHARLLLQHLADREQVLDRMVDWLAPGGWLVVADGFDLAASSTAHPRYATFFDRFWRFLSENTAIEPLWGRGYPEPLLRRGLVDVSLDVVTEPVRGGEPYARVLLQGMENLRPMLSAQEEIGEPMLDEVLANLLDPGFHDLGFALAIAKGRKAQ